MKARTMLRAVLAPALALGLATIASAQDKKLQVGDNAPGLDIEVWAKGSETTLESGNTYVVEFWATWCGPCKKSIPHLTELQKEYEDKNLTIIGISWEESDLVKKFVNQWGSKMDYTVAIDRREATKRAWLDAAKLPGIPAAFIVDGKGKIAWIGNPLDPEFDGTLKRVVGGRYDSKLAAQAAPALRGAAASRKAKNWRMASKQYDEVVALDPAVFATVALDKFDMLLNDMDDRDAAYEYSRKLIDEQFANDGEALQMLAGRMADPRIDASKRDMDMALEAAEAAQRVLGEDDPKALAGVAQIRFARGEIAQAVELQKRAYFNAAPKAKPDLKRQLEIYQQAGERQANMKPR